MDAGDPTDSAPSQPAANDSPPFRPWGAWATLGWSLVIAAVYIFIQTGVVMAIFFVALAEGRGDFVDGILTGHNGFSLSLAMLFSLFPTVTLMVGICLMRRGMPLRDYLGLHPVGMGALLRWCLALCAFALLSDSITLLLGRPLVSEPVVDAVRTAIYLPWLHIAIIACAPLVEELFFRGFLYQGLRCSPLGPVGAIVITGLMWGLIHGQYDWYGRLTITVAGLLLGYARWRTGSLLVPLAMHALMNFIASAQAIWVLREPF